MLILMSLGALYPLIEDDLNLDLIDPKIPFQIYRPPEAPDYRRAEGWYLNPALSNFYKDPRKVDVFFVHGTSFDGKGGAWLGPINDRNSNTEIIERQLPNYAGTFAVIGDIYAPKYRQASLYTQFSRHDDSLAARTFAYYDIEQAFEAFLKAHGSRQGFIIVGIDQGGLLAWRLILQRIITDPDLRNQWVAAYLIDTIIPESQFSTNSPIKLCKAPNAFGCVITYNALSARHIDRAIGMVHRGMSWSRQKGSDSLNLSPVQTNAIACVNPITGSVDKPNAKMDQSAGMANATGLEWPTQPALLSRKISAQCIGGFLIYDGPDSVSFADPKPWRARQKLPAYNLFYGDLQRDVKTRWDSYQYAH